MLLSTKAELDTARNQYTGEDFFIYRVIKLDQDKYPEGPELLVFRDPYKQGISAAIPVSVRFSLGDINHERILLKPVT
ncbi:MAG: hypothetical protein ACXVZU_04135 [Methanobacteriaceae archaeon]